MGPAFNPSGGGAIGKDKIVKITLPNNAASITGGTMAIAAFFGFDNLSSITFPPSGFTTIGDYTFSGMLNITNIVLPGSVKTIGDGAFSGCINFPSSGSLVLHPGVESIGDGAFSLTNVYDVTIPNSVTYLGSRAFYGCLALNRIILGTGIAGILDRTFFNCGALYEVNIHPNSAMASIGNEAFYGCYILDYFLIPANVSAIGDSAFRNCGILDSLDCYPVSPPTLGSNVFSGTNFDPLNLSTSPGTIQTRSASAALYGDPTSPWYGICSKTSVTVTGTLAPP
jgi:hypothetical protein